MGLYEYFFVEDTNCLRRFCSPNKGFAQQRPGLQKCGGVLAWECSPATLARVAE
jgi:hypothetical protein